MRDRARFRPAGHVRYGGRARVPNWCFGGICGIGNWRVSNLCVRSQSGGISPTLLAANGTSSSRSTAGSMQTALPTPNAMRRYGNLDTERFGFGTTILCNIDGVLQRLKFEL